VIAIRRASTAEDFAVAKSLFVEYQRHIGVDLCFQSFDRELETLSEMYAPPRGALFVAIASADGEPTGCVALRPLEPGICEMKRLYVRPTARGHHLGRELVAVLIAEARRLGYTRMRLDTLPSMGAAQALYASLGFVKIPPYNDHPIEGTEFLELAL
jgi:putative acetyltransferase